MTGDFLVGWGGVSKVLEQPDGNVTFIVVDDYTSIGLWNDLAETIKAQSTESKRFLLVMEPLANQGRIYAKGGIPILRYDQLPAVFCIRHGNDTGTYILKASLDQAKQFIEANL